MVYSQLSGLEDLVFNFWRVSKENRMRLMFLKHWVTTSVTSECRQFIPHKFSSGWSVGVVKSVEKKNSVVDQFVVNYKSEFLHNRSEKV